MASSYLPEILVGADVFSEPGRSRYEWRNQRSFAAIKSDGSVVSWGSVSTDGGEEVIRYVKEGPFKQVFSNRHSFAAIRADGKLITWGNGGRGGEKGKAKDDLQCPSKPRSGASHEKDYVLYLPILYRDNEDSQRVRSA